jgi:hypothetical protein
MCQTDALLKIPEVYLRSVPMREASLWCSVSDCCAGALIVESS